MDSQIKKARTVIARAARKSGVRVGIYASASSFDVLAEKWGEGEYLGMVWVKGETREFYLHPFAFVRRVVREIKGAWR